MLISHQNIEKRSQGQFDSLILIEIQQDLLNIMAKYKWDGHTHTQFCPHGSRDSAANMIEKAIAAGFTRYSITEHAPLPKGLMQDQQLQDELVIALSDLEDYFDYCDSLKKTYGDQIEILTGLEVDYLIEDEDYTRTFLNEYGSRLDDSILSLHLMIGKDGYRALDYSPDDFSQAFMEYYGSLEEVYFHYWQTIAQMIQSDLGKFKPGRIGHIQLIRKFQKVLPFDYRASSKVMKLINELIFPAVKKHDFSLDFNVAGLAKSTCGELYVPDFMIELCFQHNIPLVYGSDSHGVASINHHYDLYENINQA